MIKWLAVFSIWLAGTSAFASTWKSYQHNREGIKQLEKKEVTKAQREFLKALEVEPMNPELQLNLGLTFEAAEQFDKAEKTYRSVLKVVDPKSPLYFAAQFNLGEVLGKQKKIDEALQAYQACLELQPDSLEVKTNIELLFKGGQGGGDGQSQNPQQDKDQRGRGQSDAPEQKPQQQSSSPKDLSKEDMKRILDEIKNQEQGIRAQEYEKNAKETAKGKDW